MSIKDHFNRFFSMEDEYEEQLEEETDDVHSLYPDTNDQNPVNFSQLEEDSSKVVNLREDKNRANIKLVEPRVYSEVTQIADFFLRGIIVIINFQRTEDDQAKKMIDFLAGALYSIKGDMQKVGEGIFVCAPPSIGIDGIVDSFSDTRF